ncbi:hypothetical protein Tco_0072775 [Tanacetum coccineum]
MGPFELYDRNVQSCRSISPEKDVDQSADIWWEEDRWERADREQNKFQWRAVFLVLFQSFSWSDPRIEAQPVAGTLSSAAGCLDGTSA